MSSRYAATVRGGLMLFRVGFAILDEVTDILYYVNDEFRKDSPLKSVMLFILIASPCL